MNSSIVVRGWPSSVTSFMETSRDDALTYESRLSPMGNIVGFHEDMVRRECEKRNKR